MSLGRVVNASSFVSGRALNQCSPELQQRFRSEDITEDELVGLMQRFVDEAKSGEHKQGGWPDTAYGVSKLGLTVRIVVRTRTKKGQESWFRRVVLKQRGKPRCRRRLMFFFFPSQAEICSKSN